MLLYVLKAMQTIEKSDACVSNVSKSVESNSKMSVSYYNLNLNSYTNVQNADAIIISIIYSKASILFLCFIGSMTAFNTLKFSTQVCFFF